MNQVGQIFNIGGTNEVSNVDVAKELIRIMGMADREDALITFVPDRPFNDLRYTIDCAKLHALGWRELVSFQEGLAHTVKVRPLIRSFAPFLRPIVLWGGVLWTSLVSLTTFALFIPACFACAQWYKENSARFGNVDSALVAHPRAGLTSSASSNQLI